MKNLMIVLVLSFVFIQTLSAQLTPKGGSMVMEKNESMSLGNNTALTVQLSGIDDKLAGKIWEKFIDDYYNGKTEWQRKQKEWFTDNINIPAIGGATPVDLHARTEGKTDVKFMVWINMGNDFLSSNAYPEQYTEAEKIMNAFLVEVQKEKTRLELEGQEKELKKLEKELEKLIAAKDRAEKEIVKAQETIEKATAEIEQNGKDQELTKQKIETQKQTVDAVKDKLSKIN